MTRLVNSDITDMLNQVNQYKKVVQEAFYALYKDVCELIETNNFRGEGASAYKAYLKVVTINYIKAFINITEEVSNTLQKMSSKYTSLEPSSQGSIDTDILQDVKKNLDDRDEKLEALAAQIDLLNDEASSYISVEKLNTSKIVDDYSSIDSELANINKELLEVDSEALVEANNLMNRINELIYQLKTITNDYHEDNKISLDKVNGITTENWYKAEKDNGLAAMMKKDPFFYHSGAGYKSEGQWAKGIASDVFMYGGYSNRGMEYNTNLNNGVLSGDLTAYGYHGYENGQFTNYLKQNGSASFGDASLSGKLGVPGLSQDYFGFQGKGSVAVADASSSIVLGSDQFNGYIKGSASVLSANGYINDYVKSNGDFDFGIGGKASAADASFSVGTSAFNVPGKSDSKEYAGGNVKVTNSTSLLGLSISGKAGVSASADLDVSNTTVLDFGKINVNAVHVKLGGSLGFGAEVDVTVPAITVDMPWEH